MQYSTHPPAAASDYLAGAIRDLAAIDADGQLGDVRTAWAHECRRDGGCRPALEQRRRMAAWDSDVRRIARAASDMLGVPLAECERVARAVMERDPWRDIALDIIAEYRGRAALDDVPAVAGSTDAAASARAALARDRARRQRA